jgi:hypothetical protein
MTVGIRIIAALGFVAATAVIRNAAAADKLAGLWPSAA